MPDDRDSRDETYPNGDTSQTQEVQGTGSREEGLRDYWDDILGPRPETVEKRLARELGLAHPGTFTLATNTGRVIVKIDPNGRIEYGEGYQPDAAAELFWTHMALKRRDMEERLRHLAITEAILTRVGRADLNYERAQLVAQAETATEHDRLLAEMARRNLEVLVHSLIEVGRGLAARPMASPEDDADAPAWGQGPRPQSPARNPVTGAPGDGDPACMTCHGAGVVFGDCGDSPNVWFDPCPTCMVARVDPVLGST
jgi:hypothetical protein